MKLTRTEKIWLAVVIVFFALYNIPGVPAYGDSVGCIIHGCLTVVPLWIASFVGFRAVNRIYRLKEDSSSQDKGEVTNATGGEQ